jgi:hypothetical protein
MNINEAVLSFSKDICHISSANTRSLVRFHLSDPEKTIPNRDYGSILCEFEYLFIHIVDRYAHMICTEEIRNIFIEELGLAVINIGIESSSPNTDSKLIEEARKYEIDFLNARSLEYAKYKKLFPEEGEGTKDTLFWEFGKRITFDYLHSSVGAGIFRTHIKRPLLI